MKKLALLIILAFLFGCEKEEEPETELTPEAPIAQIGTFVTHSSFTANWSSSVNAKSYEIDVATDMNFTTILKQTTATSNSISLSNLTDNTKYHYRVRAINGSKTSANSNTTSVYTLPIPPQVVLGQVTNNSFTIGWEWCGSIGTYRVYVSKNNFPTNPQNCLPNYDGLLVSGLGCGISGLSPGTTYYCVVLAANGNIYSLNSNVISCTTLN